MNAATLVTGKQVNPYLDIYERYVDEAAFLWVLRSVAVDQPHYYPSDLAELDKRIDNNLDGLQTSPDAGWQACLRAAEFEESGEAFALAVTAFRSLEIPKIQKAIEFGLLNEQTFKGLVSALGWLPGKLCHSWIKKFFTSKDLDHKYLAMAACSVRREDPVDYLERIFARDDCLAHVKLHARALRIVGELKLDKHMPALERAISSDNDEICFWAIWSGVLLGKKEWVANLKRFALNPGPCQARTIELAFRVLPLQMAREWITELAGDKAQVRNVIKATGVLGDPQAVNWLVANMRIPELARLAGEAFTLITGVLLDANGLALDLPALDRAPPDNSDTDESIDMDDDENLPWPDPDKIAATWQKYGSGFVHGKRYFMGRPIDVETLRQHIQSGAQRHRYAASTEFAVLEPRQILINTRAKAVVEI